MKHNIQLSEVITIDTPDNRCAMAFAMELQNHLPNHTSTMVITANRPELVHSNLEVVKQHLPHFDTIHDKTTYLFLKENWSGLHERYGIKAFINELRTLIEKDRYDLYYVHRLDLFFDKVFNEEIEESILALIEAVRYNHKKVLLSYNTHTVSGKSFDKLLQNKRDLSFDVVPNNDGECDLTMQTHNRLLQKESASIVLISDQPEIRHMHKHIFGSEPKIRFQSASLQDLEKAHSHLINEDTDLIIYNDSRKILDSSLAKLFKKEAPYAQLYWLTNRKSIRKTDLIESKKIGIELLFPKNFDIKEYIQYVEQVIQNQFYTHKLDDLSFNGENQVVDIRELMQRISELEKKNILFSLVTVNLSDIKEENIPSLIRKDDFVFMDQNHNIVLFVLINIMQEQAKQIIADRVHVNRFLVKTHSVENLTSLLQ
jgi:hypothetical protein